MSLYHIGAEAPPAKGTVGSTLGVLGAVFAGFLAIVAAKAKAKNRKA